MRRFATVVLASVLAGCRSSTPPAPAPPPAPIAPPPPVHFGPGTAHYRAVSQLRVEQEFNGQVQDTDVRLSYYATTRITLEDTRLRVTLTLDSMGLTEVPSISSAELARARGATFTAILSPEGELTEFTASDSTTPVLQQLSPGFREFFPRIPIGGAKAGQQWTDTAEARSNFAGTALTIRSVNRNDVVGPAEFLGEHALHIRTLSSYTVTGAGSQAGQALTIDGQGDRTSDRYLSPQGVYLGYTAADSSRFSVQLTGLGMVVPVRQARADTLTVIR